ncbi:oligosaccharide flippase family protein [Thermococcus barophilus]|uniref:Capsular polysaccharide biosynthesis protein n=1 Tax=Thermococcus barophilus (strain DSM 11836 / MP) TaxID=391623 RepID=F0LLT4_THEBM|nr:oligosaccharide flippase family protein [Thermococcus barophilus]ADT83861.1 capsular polysaccharide biosynthesis protein [Thermococcus barophilus MP]
MKTKIISILNDKFVKDAAIMTLATTFANFFNYLYQLIMGRLLVPSEYGDLFSLLSLFYIFSVIFAVINVSTAKFTTIYSLRGEYEKIKGFLIEISKKLCVIGFIIAILAIFISDLLASFLNINTNLALIYLSLAIPFALLFTLHQGILRGLQRFTALGLSIVGWAFLKLLFGILLVLIWKNFLGGIAGFTLAYVIILALTFFYLRDILKFPKMHHVDLKGFIKYSWISFLALFSYSLMWNIDVILVKHYFPPFQAGIYAAISVLGKIVLFASVSIGIVLFPESAQRYEKNESHLQIFLRALGLTAAIGFGIIAVYVFFPYTIVKIIYGEGYMMIAEYLWKYGTAMLLLSLVNVTLNYALSINIKEIAYSLLLGNCLEIIFIYTFRTSIDYIINSLVTVMLITLIVSLLQIWRHRK